MPRLLGKVEFIFCSGFFVPCGPGHYIVSTYYMLYVRFLKIRLVVAAVLFISVITLLGIISIYCYDSDITIFENTHKSYKNKNIVKELNFKHRQYALNFKFDYKSNTKVNNTRYRLCYLVICAWIRERKYKKCAESIL